MKEARPILTARPARLALLPVVLLAWLALVAPVSAHAELVSSDPPANASLVAAPDRISLTFSEPIDAPSSSVRLLDVRQDEIEGVGEISLTSDGTVATIALPELEAGTYTVSYQVTSTVDGHVTSGIFAFLVDPTGTQPAPAVGPQTESLSSEPAAVAARWVSLVAILALAGMLIFWLVSARPVLAAGSVGLVSAPWFGIAVLGLSSVGALVAYLLLAGRPIVEAVGGTQTFPLDPAGPFGWTQFAIAMRVALAGTLAATLLALARLLAGPRRDAAWLALTLGAAILGLAGMSFAGHAAASGGAAFAALDLLHLLGVAAWLGTLVGLVALALRTRTLLGAAVRRHSRVALFAAPLVVLTGIANSPLVLGDRARELVASDYGNLLLAKALLFSVAVGIGAVNFMIVRRGGQRGIALPLVGAELAVGVAAVLAAAGMVTGQPAAGRVPVLTSSAIGTAHLYGTAGASSVHAAVNLPSPGQQRYQVSVADAQTGAYRTDVQRVFLVFEPPDGSELPPERVQLAAADQPWLWGTTGAYTPVVGEWQVEVVVRRTGELDESAAFPLSVAEPLPPQAVPPPDVGVGVPVPLAAAWAALPTGMAGWGLALALLGVAALAFLVGRRRGSTALTAVRTAIVLAAVVAGLAAGSRAFVQAANAPPAAAAARANPVPADEASLARGEALYLANCSSCHGAGGAGDGPATAGMLPAPAPLDEVVPGLSDGTIAYRIAAGSAGTRMPPFAASLSENDRWDIVNYLRSRWP